MIHIGMNIPASRIRYAVPGAAAIPEAAEAAEAEAPSPVEAVVEAVEAVRPGKILRLFGIRYGVGDHFLPEYYAGAVSRD